MNNEYSVLLVEKNVDDARYLVNILEHGDLPVSVQVATDGQQALSLLLEQGSPGKDAPVMPSMVLLGLDSFAGGGLAVLEDMKRQPLLRRIPVIALTALNSADEMRRAYDFGVNGCMIKPDHPEEFQKMILGMTRYWLTCNKSAKGATA